ncbi:MAG: hypothetical protein LBC79_06590, partial [Deltaproteobacteria bacterium]|nr:hypothetical protein [Deltaproteobacteria bacterium]
DAPAFKNWFGDSKAVDAEGGPLVVYRGDAGGLESFRTSNDWGYGGSFFSSNRQVAEGFAGRGETYPVYLSLRKPLEIDAQGRFHDQIARPDFMKGSGAVDAMELAAFARDNGYDGIIIRNVQEPTGFGDNFIAFEPTQVKSVHNRGTFDPNDPHILYQPAFHGSPYHFDKFTLDHIGTGEGAQAYGWGLYFAGERKVAEWYRKNLQDRSKPIFEIDGFQYRFNGQEWIGIDEHGEAFYPDYPEVHALNALRFDHPDEAAQKLREAGEDKAARLIEEGMITEKEPGQLYKVNIPENDELLDWDKPLSEQPERVRKVLEENLVSIEQEASAFVESHEKGFRVVKNRVILSSNFRNRADAEQFAKLANAGPLFGLLSKTPSDGKTLYDSISAYFDSDRAASEYLNSIGVKGIRYLDGQSRGSDEGSHNFVIFDDSAIDVLNTYCQPGARGAVHLTAESAAIRLFRNADLTTVAHESAHIFLDNLLRVVADDGRHARALHKSRIAEGMEQGKAQEILDRHLEGVRQARTDLRSLREFAEEQRHKMPLRLDGAPWEAVPLDGDLTDGQLRTLHEVTATAYEKYLVTAEAPSRKLEGVFSRLKAWTKKIYANAMSIGIEPTPEVARVFDRMLATDRAMRAKREGMEEVSGLGADEPDASDVEKAEKDDDEGEDTDTARFMDDAVAVTSRFSVYDDVKRKLIAKGIPADEIAFIHDANTDIRKAKLFADTQAGRVRVLMGSTSKMGAGTNVQKRLVAAHHLDAPWRPSDLEQRNGRIIRQGNMLYERDPNFSVGIYYYATKRTYDARMWQTIEYKAAAIEQFRKGDLLQRVIEDVQSEAANAADMKAAASGNPLILAQVKLASDLRKLEALHSQHQRSQHRLQDRLRWVSTAQKRLDEASAVHDSDIKRRDVHTHMQRDSKGKERIKVELVINGRVLGEKDEAALKAAFVGGAKAATQKGEKRALVGSYRGFEVYAMRHWRSHAGVESEGFRFALKGAGEQEFLPENLTYSFDDSISLSGWFQRMDNFLDKSLEQSFQARKAALEREIAEQATVRAALGQEFPQKDELALTRENHAAVMRELKRMQDEPSYVSTWTPRQAAASADLAVGAPPPGGGQLEPGQRLAASQVGAVPVKQAVMQATGQSSGDFLRSHILVGTVPSPSKGSHFRGL